jgi:MscS family membrane protein
VDDLMRGGVRLAAAVLLGVLAVAPTAHGQVLPQLLPPAPATPPAAAPAPAAQPVPEAHDSPRASARAFLDLTTQKRDFTAAARYLALPKDLAGRGADLARRLRGVLEQSLVLDLDKLSPLPEGATDDELPRGVDRIGSIPDANGLAVPLYVVRTSDKDGAFWAMSRDTVSHIDEWYDALPDRWVRGWMPESLQRPGPFDLLWWQWLALPVMGLVALLLGRLLAHGIVLVLARLFARTTNEWDDQWLARTEPALRLFVAVMAAEALLPLLALLPEAEQTVELLLDTAAAGAVFWGLWRSVEVWRLFLMARPWAADNASARSLLSVAINFVKLLVGVTGVLAVLAVLGYPVATVVAGLGIGGLAVAFGAQKTIENLFGSVALAVDQPFRVGDFVKIEDFTGNVERIGMRSTQIRTLDRTTVSRPNGKLSEMRIEAFGTRDRIRFATTVGLVYGTTEAQVAQVVLEIERLLRSTPGVWPDGIVSQLSALGPSSLDIEVMCWFETADFNEFRGVRQGVLLGILRVVREAGTSIALPTSTVKIERTR